MGGVELWQKSDTLLKKKTQGKDPNTFKGNSQGKDPRTFENDSQGEDPSTPSSGNMFGCVGCKKTKKKKEVDGEVHINWRAFARK